MTFYCLIPWFDWLDCSLYIVFIVYISRIFAANGRFRRVQMYVGRSEFTESCQWTTGGSKRKIGFCRDIETVGQTTEMDSKSNR